MKTYCINNFNLGMQKNNFALRNASAPMQVFFGCEKSMQGIVNETLGLFKNEVLNKMPEHNIYPFEALSKEFKGIEDKILCRAKIELAQASKKDGKPRLNVLVYDKKNPQHNDSVLLLAGNKNEILSYLKDEKTPQILRDKIFKIASDFKNDSESDLDYLF